MRTVTFFAKKLKTSHDEREMISKKQSDYEKCGGRIDKLLEIINQRGRDIWRPNHKQSKLENPEEPPAEKPL